MHKSLGLLIVLLLTAVGVQAQSVQAQNQRREQIEKEIALIDKQLSSNKAQQQNSLRALSLLQQKIDSRKELLSEVEMQISRFNKAIQEKRQEIERLREEYERLEKSYLDLIYKAYTHRDKRVWLAYVLAGENFQQAYRRWRYFKSYSEYMQHQAVQMKQVGALLTTETTALEQQQQEALALQTNRQKELSTLNGEEREARQTIQTMTRQERTLKNQQQAKQKELEKINKEVARLLAEEERKRKAAGATVQAQDLKLASEFEQNRGHLPWPLRQGLITEKYGEQTHPVFKNIKLPFNNGVGILAPAADEVYVVFDGTVKQVLFMPGYNQCVLVQHGLYYTFYCKLSGVQVRVGDSVKTGAALGRIAEIDGAHILHFEVWRGTEKQNPELWIKK